jgi:hypothetical protein
MDFVIRTFLGRPSYCLDWEPRKDTAEDVAKGRARRIPVSTSMAEAFGLGGVIALYEAGKL